MIIKDISDLEGFIKYGESIINEEIKVKDFSEFINALDPEIYETTENKLLKNKTSSGLVYQFKILYNNGRQKTLSFYDIKTLQHINENDIGTFLDPTIDYPKWSLGNFIKKSLKYLEDLKIIEKTKNSESYQIRKEYSYFIAQKKLSKK